MADLVCELAGCSMIDAQLALRKFDGNVVDAVESLLVKPPVKGDAYIPAKPKINTGMTREQEELCRRGRELQDKVNAVISVAHSQIRHESAHSHEESQKPPLGPDLKTQLESLPLTNEPQQGSSEKTPLQVPQFETLP